jgi:ribonuclease VapC
MKAGCRSESAAVVVVIDSSVVLAIFKDEPDAGDLVTRALRFERRLISAGTWLEAAMVCEGKTERGGGVQFDRIAAELKLEVALFTAAQAAIARDAFKRYGKRRHAQAALNFGDCFAYALAKELDAPLLFKGNDFVHTDIRTA